VDITWREDKRQRNIREHGLDFAMAVRVFDDPFAVTVFDRIVNGEEGWHTVGAVFIGNTFKVIGVVHTFPDGDEADWIHIISMRPANAEERRHYEQVSHR
jgi:uncharacterized protein